MKIRRYTKEDIPDLIKYLEAGLQATHYNRYRFDSVKVRQLLLGNLTNLTFFCNVVEGDDGTVEGALAASIMQPMFSHEAVAQDHITYIRPECRSLRAIHQLVNSYIRWARDRGAREVRWEQSSGFKMEKFQVLAKRYGFDQIGTKFSMEL